MRVLQTLQRNLGFMIVRSAASDQTYKNTVRSTLAIVCLLIGAISVGLFLYFEARIIQDYADTMYTLITLIIDIAILLVISGKRTDIFEFIDRMGDVIETRARNPISNYIYTSTNALIEKWAKIVYFLYAKVTIPVIAVSFMLSCYSLYYSNDLGRDAFYLPFNAWMPFDWRTPIGYLLGFACELAFIIYVGQACSCAVCFTTGSGCIMMAYADDIKVEMIALNNYILMKRHRTKLKTTFAQIVRFHSTTKQIVNDFTDTFKRVYTLFFLWAAITICITLLMIDIELTSDAVSPFVLIKLMTLTLWSSVQLFVYCEAIERVSNRYAEIDFYHFCDWCAFPVDLQHLLPTIIINTQAVILGRFGNILCTRITFGKVVKSTFSCFMLFKELGV